ncbi:MAG: hypothetical protein NUV80_00990 [Candidatus Berkelbacteria bacterium]|nr:hypothetical protein [Candidatus Berkelbacteria bacterium]
MIEKNAKKTLAASVVIFIIGLLWAVTNWQNVPPEVSEYTPDEETEQGVSTEGVTPVTDTGTTNKGGLPVGDELGASFTPRCGAPLLLVGQEAIVKSIEGKNHAEKASIKAEKIANFDLCGTYENTKYGTTVEIKSVKNTGEALEVYARAWKGTQQLGFGTDGSVETERFLFFNPPILVVDPAGTIVRRWTDEKGLPQERRLTEDPVSAIRESLAHTVKVSGKTGTNITVGSIGHTVATLYPDAGTGGPSGDGTVLMSGQTSSWATIIAAVGNTANNDAATRGVIAFLSTTTLDVWDTVGRGIFSFDNPTGTITAATFSLVDAGQNDESSNTPNINIYEATPATNFNFAGTDFDSIGSTAWSTAVTYAAWTGAAYHDFAVNATGITAIATDDPVIIGVRNATYDVGASSPTWGSNKTTNLIAVMADTAGTTTDPKLVITYTPSGRERKHLIE